MLALVQFPVLNSLALSIIQRNLTASYPPGNPFRNAILSHIIQRYPPDTYTALLQAMMDPPQTVLAPEQVRTIFGREFVDEDLVAGGPPLVQIKYPSDPTPTPVIYYYPSGGVTPGSGSGVARVHATVTPAAGNLSMDMPTWAWFALIGGVLILSQDKRGFL